MGIRTVLGGIAAAALVLGLTACGGGGGGASGGTGGTSGGGGGTGTTPTVTLTSIVITPSTTQSLVVGTTLQFTATGYYSNNTSAPLTSVVWTSSASWIASISGSGQALGLAAGSTAIYASVGGVVSPGVTLNVTSATPTSMTITPSSATIGIGQPIALAASAVFNNGTTGDVTAVSTWSTSNTSVGQLGWPYGWPNFNVVNGMSASSVTITATYLGASAVATITVAPTYAIGGKLVGLPASAAVALQNNGTDKITVNDTTISYSYGNGTWPGFVFNNTLAPGAVFNITVASQPAATHPCTVVDGAGAVNSTTPKPVTWAQVVCAPAVGTLAGNIVNGVLNTMGGYADSTVSTNAIFYSPAGIVLDPVHPGNVYVADGQSNAIRLIAASGAVSTIAGGSTTYSYVNATGTSARFSLPRGLAGDTAGNLYVADSWNNVIRMVNASGVVSTFAGQTPTMTAGAAAPASYVNATTPTGAQFNRPDGIARDGKGNLYVADSINNVIRVINASGVVSTLSGATPAMTGGAPAPAGYVNSATSTLAQFNQPDGLVVDPTNTYLYVVEWKNCAIRQVTIVSGAVTTLAGALPGAATLCGYADGAVGSALFSGMNGLAIDSRGYLYIGDTTNEVIRMITPGANGLLSSGTVSTLAGTPPTTIPWSGFADGLASQALFFYPEFLAVDSAGNVIFSDTFNNLIRKYTP